MRDGLLRDAVQAAIVSPDMSNRMTDQPPPRFSVSQLPAEVDPEEKSFARLLTQALAPSFVLVKRLGAGGMGAVYLARDPVLRRLVAVKVLAPHLATDPEARARFEREGQAVAAISHPNVVAVHSVGELENGVPYIVMQYIEGRTMADRLKDDGPLDARSAKHVIGEVASALAAAHKKGIIHRDIKPANILLDEDTGRTMVTDFGIAAVKQRGEDKGAQVDLTQAGTTVGTPAYMSPEQILAEPVTEKTDIYSLGLLAYQLFIADGPYQVSSPGEVMAAHVKAAPRPLHTMRGDVEPELQRLIESCLAKDPAQRPSAAEVEKRLQHGASILLEWPPPGLEKLRASLNAARRVLLGGAFLFALPLAAASLFDRESLIRNSLPPNQVLLAISGIGLFTFIVGLGAMVRFFDLGRRAVTAGYGWGVLFETVADVRGDTGPLIAGAREYAELSPAKRNLMRRLRLVALAFRLLAGIVPVVGYVLAVMFAATASNGPTIVLWSSLFLSVLLLAGAQIIHDREDRRMKEPRRRLRSATAKPGPVDKVAEAWMASFDQVRAGQMGGGPRSSGRGVRAAVLVPSIVIGIAGLLIFSMFLLTSLVRSAGERGLPGFTQMRANAVKVRRLAALRVAPDSSITPLRAGQALHAILRNGPGGTLQPHERAPAIIIPPQPEKQEHADPWLAPGRNWRTGAFLQAPRGFSAAQRDFLRSIADNTAIEEFRILARATGLDFAGAYLEVKPGTTLVLEDLPGFRFGSVRVAADANMAIAALDLAAGRQSDAERRVRETLSAGFLLANDGRTMLEHLFGAAMIRNARTALVALYEATGKQREARQYSAESDPVLTESSDRRSFVPIEEVSRTIRRIALDTNEIRALRWDVLLVPMWFEPCTDLHQVVFGPDSLHRATLARAKASLAVRASDSVLFSLAETMHVRPVQASGSRGSAYEMIKPISRSVSALTGNRQLEACLARFGGT